MLAKVLVLACVAVAFCEDHHGYKFKAIHREPAHEYRQRHEYAPVKVIQDREPHESQYSAPEAYRPAYSSQSVIHQAGGAEQEGSQESRDEHVAPVYQYIQEDEEAPTPAPHPSPVKHYQSIQYPAPAPVRHEPVPVHAPQPQAAIHVSKPVPVRVYSAPHYSQGHEEFNYHNGAELHSAPVQHAPSAESYGHDSHDEPVDYYAYPKYQYEYKVEDPHTGDNKFQHEYRDGDVVKGVYSLQEADGSIRTVEYSSDKHNGFSAIVKHSAPGQHVQIESHHN